MIGFGKPGFMKKGMCPHPMKNAAMPSGNSSASQALVSDFFSEPRICVDKGVSRAAIGQSPGGFIPRRWQPPTARQGK